MNEQAVPNFNLNIPVPKSVRPPPAGAVIPTGRFRLKHISGGITKLQELVRPVSDFRGQWVDIPTVSAEASDDE